MLESKDIVILKLANLMKHVYQIRNALQKRKNPRMFVAYKFSALKMEFSKKSSVELKRLVGWIISIIVVVGLYLMISKVMSDVFNPKI